MHGRRSPYGATKIALLAGRRCWQCQLRLDGECCFGRTRARDHDPACLNFWDGEVTNYDKAVADTVLGSLRGVGREPE